MKRIIIVINRLPIRNRRLPSIAIKTTDTLLNLCENSFQFPKALFIYFFYFQQRFFNSFLHQILLNQNMQKEEEINCREMLRIKSFMKQVQPFQMIIVKKERENEYDQEIDSQWKEARKNFLNHTINLKLSQCQIQEQHQIKIALLFMQAEQNYYSRFLSIDLNQKGELYVHKHQIFQLRQLFNSRNEQFARRQKETPAISQIVRLKLTQLRVINIQYSLSIYQGCRYQVSAFELFKIVQGNRELTQVTLKGVLVIHFKNFIQAIAKSRLNQLSEKKSKEWSWMKDLQPSKSLKIAIDIQDDFWLTIQEDLGLVEGLAQFGGMFSQLSVVSIKIDLEDSYKLRQVWNSLQWLFNQLAKMATIKIKVKLQGKYGSVYPGKFFTKILQMHSCLTTIAQLQLSNIRFDPDEVGINRFLAMEQILRTIFEINSVTHLRIYQCVNLPVFPTILTLQKIFVNEISFWRSYSFMSDVASNSSSLQSITFAQMSQEWMIEEQLFNQLQRLQIYQCQNVNLGDSTYSSSNIKHLAIYKYNIGSVDVLFSKLANITSLYLSQLDFGHELICTIPSPHLEALVIQINKKFANKDLEEIDKKWPKLRQLTLHDCPRLNEDGWSACDFKGLFRLSIDTRTLARGHSIRQKLRGRGITVYEKQY